MELLYPIKGYEGLYSITKSGKVYSHNRNIFLKPTISYGYLKVMLTKNGFKHNKRVHRLVSETFIPNPENKSQVNHINGIKSDNRLENLEWVTNLENMRHASINGLMKYECRGRNIGKKQLRLRKLTDNQAVEIRNKYIPWKYSTHKLAKEYGVSSLVINFIINNKTYLAI